MKMQHGREGGKERVGQSGEERESKGERREARGKSISLLETGRWTENMIPKTLALSKSYSSNSEPKLSNSRIRMTVSTEIMSVFMDPRLRLWD